MKHLTSVLFFCLMAIFIFPRNVDASEADSLQLLQGIINADKFLIMKADRKLEEASHRFSEAGYENESLKRRDFTSATAFRNYRLLRDELQQARAATRSARCAYERTEKVINDFKLSFPKEFEQIAALQYHDRFKVTHPLRIFISTGYLAAGIDEGQTSFNLSQNDEIYCKSAEGITLAHAVRITLGVAAKKDDVLAHEFGHVMGLAASPRGYFNALSRVSCEFNCQENLQHPVASPAMNMQLRGKQKPSFAKATAGEGEKESD